MFIAGASCPGEEEVFVGTDMTTSGIFCASLRGTSLSGVIEMLIAAGGAPGAVVMFVGTAMSNSGAGGTLGSEMFDVTLILITGGGMPLRCSTVFVGIERVISGTTAEAGSV